MICHMLHQVNQFHLRCADRKHSFEMLIRQELDELNLLRFHLRPLSLDRRKVGKSVGIEQNLPSRHHVRYEGGVRRRFLPILKPSHSPAKMCARVSRTDEKLPPRSRVNCSLLSPEQARNTRLFAQRSYSYSKSMSVFVTGVAWDLLREESCPQIIAPARLQRATGCLRLSHSALRNKCGPTSINRGSISNTEIGVHFSPSRVRNPRRLSSCAIFEYDPS